MITQSQLKEHFDYNPETGDFIWRKIGKGRKGIGKTAGTVKGNGYHYLNFGEKAYLSHRMAFLFMVGEIPCMIDHRDGDPLNNKWDNLRDCSHSQNMCNARIRSDNKSGAKGVSWFARDKKWEVVLRINKAVKYLGRYEDFELAELISNEARDLFHGKFSRTL